MLLNYSCDKGFERLWGKLKRELPSKMFDLEGVGKQLDYAQYTDDFYADDLHTTADVSVDSNSNVSDKGVASFPVESVKPMMKLESYHRLWVELKKAFGVRHANRILRLIMDGSLYVNDSHGVAPGIPYCFNYTCYDIAAKGLTVVDKVDCKPPKYLSAFKSQLEQFITVASNSTNGASGIADLLIVMAMYFQEVLKTKKVGHFELASEEDCWEYLDDTLTSLIYTVNQNMRGTQCVTEDTEVLTPKGFRKYHELNVGDDIYTWNNGKLNVQKVEKVNVSDYDGEMHQYTGGGVKQVVTPNHRVLYKMAGESEYSLMDSAELMSQDSSFSLPAAMLENDTPDYDITDDMLRLCTAVVSNGFMDMKGAGKVRLFKSPNVACEDILIELLENMGVKYAVENKTRGGEEYRIFNLETPVSQGIIRLLGMDSSKFPEWVMKLSKRQAEVVLDMWALMNDFKYVCPSVAMADQIQHLFFLTNTGSKIKTVGGEIQVVPFTDSDIVMNKNKTVQYKGKVWCPTTSDGVVVFRKDGAVFVSGNSPFTNVSIFDDKFLDELCGDYMHPETLETVDKEVVKKIQKLYINIMNRELRRTTLTFPVTTACMCVDGEEIVDKDFLQDMSERNMEFGFINFYFGTTSTLSSCCRLRSDLTNEYFNSFGASGSSKIGSSSVASINLPRIAYESGSKEEYLKTLKSRVRDCCMINYARRNRLLDIIAKGRHRLYTDGFIDINRQYITTGFNGMYEAVTEMGFDMMTKEGQDFGVEMLNAINKANDSFSKKYKLPINCEQIPAENVSVKLAEKDKVMGLNDKYPLYSNQFIPLTSNADLLDRIKLQGMFDSKCSGGAIAHLNVENRIDNVEDMVDLLKESVRRGAVYVAVNYMLAKCENKHMSVTTGTMCPECGGAITDHYSRVVGFLVNVSNMHQVRREKDVPNRKFYEDIQL